MNEYQQIQQAIENIRDVSESIHDDAPATSGFLDGVREDLREAQRMYRGESLKGRIEAEMSAVEDPD